MLTSIHREKKMSRMRAIKVVDHALLGVHGATCANRFVEILGLKALFSAIMKKGAKKYKKEYPDYSLLEEDGGVSLTLQLNSFNTQSSH
jgi:beta-catenin-like protein 1